MRIKFVHENGQIFQSKNEETEGGETLDEIFSVFYDSYERLDKLKFELEDGSMIVLGKEAIQRGALIVSPE